MLDLFQGEVRTTCRSSRISSSRTAASSWLLTSAAGGASTCWLSMLSSCAAMTPLDHMSLYRLLATLTLLLMTCSTMTVSIGICIVSIPGPSGSLQSALHRTLPCARSPQPADVRASFQRLLAACLHCTSAKCQQGASMQDLACESCITHLTCLAWFSSLWTVRSSDPTASALCCTLASSCSISLRCPCTSLRQHGSLVRAWSEFMAYVKGGPWPVRKCTLLFHVSCFLLCGQHAGHTAWHLYIVSSAGLARWTFNSSSIIILA